MGAWLTASLMGTAAAQSCELPERLLQVTVSGSERGDHVVYLATSPQLQVYLPAALIRASEEGLVGTRVVCQGQMYFSPAGAARVQYDEENQQLDLSIAPERLGSRVLDLSGQRTVTPPPAVPAFGVSAAADVTGTWRAPLSPTVRAALGAGYAQGAVQGVADVLIEGSGDGWAITPRGQVAYSVTPDVLLSGHWNTSPSGGTPGLQPTDFRGVSLQGQVGARRTLPVWELSLPLDAEVVVLLDGQELRRVTATAGVLRIQGVEVDRQGFHILTVRVTDDTGTRELAREFLETYSVLPAGSGTYALSVGQRTSGWSAEGRGEFGLTDHLSVSASALWTRDLRRAGARLNYAAAPWSHQFGVRYQSGAGQSGAVSLDLATRYRTRQWLLSAAIQSPLRQLSQTTLTLGAAYLTPAWTAFASYQGSPAVPWDLNGGLSYQVTPASVVAVTAGASPGAYRAGLTLTYEFSPSLRGVAFAQGAGGRSEASAAGVEVQYQPAPGHLLDAGFRTPAEGTLGYRYSGPVQVTARASTAGEVSASARGAVTLVAGQALVSPALAQRAILLKTGIPQLPLLIGGSVSVTTNGKGEVLLSELTPGQSIEVSVDLTRLPITLGVQDERVLLLPPLSGVATFDWRENFSLSRWVRVRWPDGAPAAGARLELQGRSYDLGDGGDALLPDTAEELTGQLTGADGRSCAVAVQPGQTEVTCRP